MSELGDCDVSIGLPVWKGNDGSWFASRLPSDMRLWQGKPSAGTERFEDATFEQQELLQRQILEIEAPPIHGAPIAFAFYVSVCPPENSPRSLSAFPSLSDSIKSFGMEAAIRIAFGMTPETAMDSTEAQPRRAPWWRRLFFSRKPQQSILTSGFAEVITLLAKATAKLVDAMRLASN